MPGSKWLLVLVALSPPLTAAEWEDPRRLGRGGRSLSFSAQETTVDLAFVRCKRREVSGPERCKCRHTRSVDEGASWGPVRVCVKPPGGRYGNVPGVQIASVGDVVHVAGRAHGGRSRGIVYYGRSEDGGQTWLKGRWFGEGFALSVRLAAVGDDVHLAWETNNPADRFRTDLVYYRSTDGGRTWGPERRLAVIAGERALISDARIDLAADGRWVHLTWVGDDDEGRDQVFYRRSLDGGRGWKRERVLSSGDRDSIDVRMAVDRRNVHVVWLDLPRPLGNVDAREWRLRQARSLDRGRSWSRQRLVVDEVAAQRIGLRWHYLTAREGLVDVVVRGFARNNNALVHVESANGGRSWKPPERIATRRGLDELALARSASHLHLAHVTFPRRARNSEVEIRRRAACALSTAAARP